MNKCLVEGRLYLENLKLLNRNEVTLCLLLVSVGWKDNQEATLTTLGMIFLAPNVFQSPDMRKVSSIYVSLKSLVEMVRVSLCWDLGPRIVQVHDVSVLIGPTVQKYLPLNMLTLVKEKVSINDCSWITQMDGITGKTFF